MPKKWYLYKLSETFGIIKDILSVLVIATALEEYPDVP